MIKNFYRAEPWFALTFTVLFLATLVWVGIVICAFIFLSTGVWVIFHAVIIAVLIGQWTYYIREFYDEYGN